jgi:hypothetical protein
MRMLSCLKALDAIASESVMSIAVELILLLLFSLGVSTTMRLPTITEITDRTVTSRWL